MILNESFNHVLFLLELCKAIAHFYPNEAERLIETINKNAFIDDRADVFGPSLEHWKARGISNVIKNKLDKIWKEVNL